MSVKKGLHQFLLCVTARAYSANSILFFFNREANRWERNERHSERKGKKRERSFFLHRKWRERIPNIRIQNGIHFSFFLHRNTTHKTLQALPSSGLTHRRFFHVWKIRREKFFHLHPFFSRYTHNHIYPVKICWARVVPKWQEIPIHVHTGTLVRAQTHTHIHGRVKIA